MKIQEEWRPIEWTGGRYKISDAGRVQGPSGNLLTPTLMKIGYYTVAISAPGKKSTKYYIHRLVVETFISIISPGLVVNHKNHDKLDNQLSNLELIDRSANGSHWATKGHSKSAGRKRSGICGRGHQLLGDRPYCLECRKMLAAGNTDSPPNDTDWRKCQVPGYLISSDGRLWSERSQRLLRPGVNKPGYEYFNLRIEGQTKPFAVQRLVAEAFIGPIGVDMVVDHINGEKTDNHVSNLRIISKSNNSIAFHDKSRANG